MAIREIITIDEEKCDGCGLCVPACAEGAIQIVNGKAKLVSEVFCDGLGACLGDCPLDAITMVKVEAADYDEAAVARHLISLKGKQSETQPLPIIPSDPTAPQAAPAHGGGCPGSAMRKFGPVGVDNEAAGGSRAASSRVSQPEEPSQLGHWPIQLMLVPPHAPFLRGSDLVICADCVPFTVPDFHQRYLTNRALLVGCPKLDDLNHYFDKFKMILAQAEPKSVTVLKMEVPCCSGIAQVAVQARNEVNPGIPIEVHTIGIRGGIVVDTKLAGAAA